MNIVIKSIVSLLLLVIVMPSIAQANEEEALSGSLLWKVSGKDLTEPSYILGTHHLIPKSFADSIVGLQEAISNTKQVVGEVDMSDMNTIQAKMQGAAMMPQAESYKTLLSGKDYAILDKGLKEVLGVGLDQIGSFKPGLISTLYTIAVYSKLYPEFNPTTHEAVDAYLQSMALQQGKKVVGLETPEQQIYALFDAEPLKTQAEALVCGIKNIDNEKETTQKLSKLYRNGKLAEMNKLALHNPNEPCRISQDYQDTVLTNRNNNWMKQLPKIMKDEASLIVVGALHLPGENGILHQLAEKGYTVEAIK